MWKSDDSCRDDKLFFFACMDLNYATIGKNVESHRIVPMRFSHRIDFHTEECRCCTPIRAAYVHSEFALKQ